MPRHQIDRLYARGLIDEFIYEALVAWNDRLRGREIGEGEYERQVRRILRKEFGRASVGSLSLESALGAVR